MAITKDPAALPRLSPETAHLHGMVYLGPDGDGRAMYDCVEAVEARRRRMEPDGRCERCGGHLGDFGHCLNNCEEG